MRAPRRSCQDFDDDDLDLTECQSDAVYSSGAVPAAAITAHPASAAASAVPPSARYVSPTPASLALACTASRAAGCSGATNGNQSSPAGGSASPLELLVAAVTDLQRRVAELEEACVEVEEEDLMDDDAPATSSKRVRVA